MTITICPKCGSMNITTAGTCANCGWSQFAQVTVSPGVYETIGELEIKVTGKALLDDYKRLLFENNSLTVRIAELEADKELLNSCESALISMVNQFFYSKAGENIFRHSFMSAEEEAAEYLVEHGIARWVGKNKSAICFNEVQE